MTYKPIFVSCLILTYTMGAVDVFNAYRKIINDKIMAQDNLVIKRLFNLNINTYKTGALETSTKELLGLVASMVFRFGNCINNHLEKCKNQEITTNQLFESFSIANIVGGTIVVPRLRRAVVSPLYAIGFVMRI